ncbi:DUF1272 domain-containing protein [Roseibium sp. SCP14]|uniref:DUF1272 domain-containing protein n=1 Tax=Roseibium sp. SCP14 TaxID=3141375 RepID=UPI0033358DF0
MLELRPNCELCDCDLPPSSGEARICSYECTYCTVCVETRLHNVCPTCGGGFTQRPIRPRLAYRPEFKLGLVNDPASTKRKHSKFTAEEIERFVTSLCATEPAHR